MLRVKRNIVAIVPIENPDKIGSIIVPDIAKERLNQGFVMYRGKDVHDLRVGDYVIFSAYDGTLIHIPEEGKLILMPESSVQAVLDIAHETKEIPGLWFHDKSLILKAFPATFQLAMQYIAMAFEEDEKFRDSIRVPSYRGDKSQNVEAKIYKNENEDEDENESTYYTGEILPNIVDTSNWTGVKRDE